MTTDTSPATPTLCTLLACFGYQKSDFSIKEYPGSGIANSLGLDGGIVTVRHLATGVERFYATGEGSAWFGAFVMDLGWGHFRSQTSLA